MTVFDGVWLMDWKTDDSMQRGETQAAGEQRIMSMCVCWWVMCRINIRLTCETTVVACAPVLFILPQTVEIPWTNIHHVEYIPVASCGVILICGNQQNLKLYNGIED